MAGYYFATNILSGNKYRFSSAKPGVEKNAPLPAIHAPDKGPGD
jgi:hypothetical protein